MSLATANYPTQEASAFDNHEVDLYGFAGLQRVELCYVLNEFETAIVWVGISARNNGAHLWKIELSETGILAPATQLPLFDDVVDVSRLAKLKDDNKDDRKSDKKNEGK